MTKRLSKEKITQWMARAMDPEEQYAVAALPDCPPEVLLWLTKNMANTEYSALSLNPNLPEEAIEFLIVNSIDSYQKAELIQHPNFNKRLMDIVSADPDPYTRAEAVRSSSEKRLFTFAKDPEAMVRAVVAENPYAPVEILLYLLDDSEIEVLFGLIRNEIIHDEVWDGLLGKPKEVIEKLAIEMASGVPKAHIDRAREVIPIDYHQYFLSNLATPQTWLDEFLNDSRYNLEAFVPHLVNSGPINVAHMPILINSKNINMHLKIAATTQLSREIQEKLVKNKSASVRAVFASNPTADIDLLKQLLNDKSVTVIENLRKEKYWDQESRSQLPYEGRLELIALATASSSNLESKMKITSVTGRSEALQSETIDLKRYEELLLDKSIGIKTAATLRAAELRIISFKDAALFVSKNAPQTTMPKNRWVDARMAQFKKDNNEAYLDLVIALEGDQTLAFLFMQEEVSVSQKQLMKIAKAHLPMTNWNLAKKVELTADLLDELSQTASFSYDTFGEAAGDLEFGQWAGETTSGYRVASYPQAIAANHKLTRPETIEKLRKSRSKYVRGVVFLRDDLTTSEHIKLAAKDKDAYMRNLAAQHNSAPLEILEKLAGDKDAEVRKSACAHKLATKEMKATAALLN